MLNKTLPNIKEIIKKHWSLLQININLKDVSKEKPTMCYWRNRYLCAGFEIQASVHDSI